MSTTSVPTPVQHFGRVRRAGHSVRNVFAEMVVAREVGLGRPRR